MAKLFSDLIHCGLYYCHYLEGKLQKPPPLILSCATEIKPSQKQDRKKIKTLRILNVWSGIYFSFFTILIVYCILTVFNIIPVGRIKT
jgi:hypothetical protein